MTYETFDNFLTLMLTAMIYGTGLWLAIAFPLFVVRHDLSSDRKEGLQATSTQAIVEADTVKNPAVSLAEAQQLHQPAFTVESQAPSSQREISQQPVSQIVSEPVNFGLWKVADLRWTKLRESFDIPLRPKGKNRAYKKTELKALYMAAMEQFCDSEKPPHLVGG